MRFVWFAIGLLGCNGAEPEVPSGSVCERGCEATLAADCANGPVDQASCVATCEDLAAGSCAAEYADVQTCSDGEQVGCDGSGRPIVEACAAEFGAFVACLNPG